MLATTLAALMTLSGPMLSQESDLKMKDLSDGFVRVTTEKFIVEIPKGWEMSSETPWGARDIDGPTGEMGTMTGSARNRTWDQLYQTSLYFILRSSPGTPTKYEIIKTKQGYDAMSFQVLNKEKEPTSLYVIQKNAKTEEILALSVKIKDRKNEKQLKAAFDRFVNTAKMK